MTGTPQHIRHRNRITKANSDLNKDKAFDLMLTGMDVRSIAPLCGVTKSTVSRWITARLQQLAVAQNEKTEKWRALELAKLDRLEVHTDAVLTSHHVTVDAGQIIYLSETDRVTGAVTTTPLLDDAPVLEAVKVKLQIAAQRAKLLGLNAPVKLEGTQTNLSAVRVIVEYTDPEPRPALTDGAGDVVDGFATEVDP
jgi:hypothetical protein